MTAVICHPLSRIVHLSQKLKLTPDEPLSVYVETSMPLPPSEVLDEIHQLCKGVDGFLHLKYSHVSDNAR